jgi:nitrile hydratase accessory protein
LSSPESKQQEAHGMPASVPSGAGMDLAGDEPVFREPWEAQAFSLAVSLSARGVFTWPEWARSLSRVIKDPQTADLPYYEQWLVALEDLVCARQLVDEQELAARREAWRAAASQTPHGQPIVLPPN